jgi:cell division protein FtsB
MRWLTPVLAALLLLIQYPLWFGKGGWLKAWEAERQVVVLREANGQLATRNAALAAEVLDLRQGDDAVAERARAELGMIGPRELFFRIVPQTRGQGSGAGGQGENRPAAPDA